MTIAIRCPECGKQFNLAEELAGMRGRCSRCKAVFRIHDRSASTTDSSPGRTSSTRSAPKSTPTSRPVPQSNSTTKPKATPKPKPASDSGPDIYDYSEAFDEEAEEEPIGSPLLKNGKRIASMSVEECSATRLVLACRLGRILFLALAGVISLSVGHLMVGGIIKAQEARQGSSRGHRLGLVISVGLVGFGVGTVSLLGRLGYRAIFDGESKSFSIRRLYTFDQTWKAHELSRLVFRIYKPDHEDNLNKANIQKADAFVVSQDGQVVALIERVSYNSPKYIVPLAQACLQAGRLLRIPVHVELLGPPMHAEYHQAVKLIVSSGGRNSPNPHSRLRAPWLTTYTVGTFLATVAIVLYSGRILIGRGAQAQGFLSFTQGPKVPGDGVGSRPPHAEQSRTDPKELEAIDRLLKDLEEGIEQEKQTALFFLRRRIIPPERRDAGARLFRELTASDDVNTRSLALSGLGHWGTDADLQILTAELESPTPQIREGAIVGLARSGKPYAAEILVNQLRNPNHEKSVGPHLQDFGPGAEPAVAKLLDESDPRLINDAAVILEIIGTQDSVLALESALDRRPQLGPVPSQQYGSELKLYADERNLQNRLRATLKTVKTRGGSQGGKPLKLDSSRVNQ